MYSFNAKLTREKCDYVVGWVLQEVGVEEGVIEEAGEGEGEGEVAENEGGRVVGGVMRTGKNEIPDRRWVGQEQQEAGRTIKLDEETLGGLKTTGTLCDGSEIWRGGTKRSEKVEGLK